jgi:hypothetical protein
VTYYFEMPDGTRLNQEQYNEQKAKKIDAEIAAEHQEQDEAARLVAELSEAYKACSGYMKSHPALVRKVGDAEAQEHDLYLKLRQNLERADEAPRCEKVRVDGTVCECPRMKGYSYCYAHERMLQARPRKLALPALEDANAIQLSIMMVQKALIDGEISEKKAGLLLYSIQIAASNVKQTTFIHEEDKEVVTEMPEESALSSQHSVVSQGKSQNQKSLTTKDIKEHEGKAGNTCHGDAGSGDLEIGGSGDREKAAPGVGQLVIGEIKSESKTRKPQGTQKSRIGRSGDREIG